MRRILFYVQHLLGIGHVFRASRIAGSLAARGLDVHIAHGGARIPHLSWSSAKVHYLPPIHGAKNNLSELVTPDDDPVDNTYKASRRDRLLFLFHDIKPDMLITEAFPFGRRQMRFELLPLLEEAKAAAPKPIIVSSVRDIVQENRKPGRNDETVATLESYFDHVFVHGDPNFARLEETFPEFERIADKALYTGIVAPDRETEPAPSHGKSHDVIVSVGGGSLGAPLLLAAAEAAPKTSLKDARWCLLTGPYLPEDVRGKLKALAPPTMEIHEFLPDLRQMLANTELSISLTGYNTVADLLRAECRAIVVPQWDGTETEQLRRARIMDKKGLAVAIMPDDISAETLAETIDHAMAAPPPPRGMLNLEGAKTTADIVEALFDGALPDAYR